VTQVQILEETFSHTEEHLWGRQAAADKFGNPLRRWRIQVGEDGDHIT
jgi:hypothetical protein